jgi:methionine aminopeptidase
MSIIVYTTFISLRTTEVAHFPFYSVIVGASTASPVTGIKADLVAAAHNVTELVLRSIKPGVKNWEITDLVAKLIKEYNGSVKGMEGKFFLVWSIRTRCSNRVLVVP